MRDFGGGGGGITVTESADKTYALSSSVNHTFDSAPKLYGAYLRCTTTEQGYAVGEKVQIHTGMQYDGSNYQAQSVSLSGSTVTVSNRFYIWGASKTGSAATTFDNAKWVIVIWAVL